MLPRTKRCADVRRKTLPRLSAPLGSLALLAAVGIGACSGAEDPPRRVSGGDAGVAMDSSSDAPAGPPSITAAAVLAKLSGCATKISSAPYATDSGGSPSVDVCERGDAVYFTADMDIDCDGKSSAVCNESTDPYYQGQTAATESSGEPLDSATLPFIVVPGVSSRWSYKASGIKMGSVGAVIYNGEIEYGIVGDVGPASIIGEASYAMAERLGIDPNPKTGGVSSGVTYVIFKGASVPKNEDRAATVALGETHMKQLVDGDSP